LSCFEKLLSTTTFQVIVTVVIEVKGNLGQIYQNKEQQEICSKQQQIKRL